MIFLQNLSLREKGQSRMVEIPGSMRRSDLSWDDTVEFASPKPKLTAKKVRIRRILGLRK